MFMERSARYGASYLPPLGTGFFCDNVLIYFQHFEHQYLTENLNKVESPLQKPGISTLKLLCRCLVAWKIQIIQESGLSENLDYLKIQII